MQPMLQVNDLCVRHGDKMIVGPVSFQLLPHQSLTILGETGAGKSLLAKAIFGDLPSGFVIEGEIRVSGQAIQHLSREERQRLWGHTFSVLPQEPSLALSPLMAVHDQIEEVYRLVLNRQSDEARKLSRTRFADIGLAGDERKYPAELSGGMAQRCAYLCATSAGGPLLIADEPTKGLDDVHRLRIVDMLQAHRQQGTLITITHDIEVAEKLSGQLIVIRQGQVVEQGEAASILSRPEHPYTRQLVQAHPRYWEADPLPTIGAPLVDVTHLSVVISAQNELLRDLSFQLHRGEILGLSGPSGCGKSTLCNVILGLHQPRKGAVHYLEPMAAGQMLKLYQDPPNAFPSHFTLGTLMDDLCQRFQLSRTRLDELMVRLRLTPELLTRKPRQVSGGELQRFAILRVLLLRPKLLIADEPTTRLDPVTAKETLALILDIAREINCAMILVSHEQAVLEKVCHRVINLPDASTQTVNLAPVSQEIETVCD
jgi:peptide/nickel transport system ATP-binding protein